MNGLIDFWVNDYFTDLCLTIALFILLFASLGKGRRHSQFKYFPLYFGSFILLQAVNYSFYFDDIGGFSRKQVAWLGRYIDCVVTIIEYFAFTYFFVAVLKTRRTIHVVKASFIILSILCLFLAISDTMSKHIMTYSSISIIYMAELIGLAMFCFFYFHELFKTPPKAFLVQDPNFWTVTGLTFYSICTIPATVILNYFVQTNYLLYAKLFTIIHIFYLILFFMLIKSFYCAPLENMGSQGHQFDIGIDPDTISGN